MSSKSSDLELSQFTPQFLWILRDFTLEMQDQKGNRITPKQYLENALKDSVNLSLMKKLYIF